MIYEQKLEQQEGNMKRCNVMGMQKELQSNRPTRSNKDKAKNIENEEQTESEEQTEPEDAFNLILDYFDKTFEGMQARINKNMESPAKKYKNQLEKT